MGGGKGGSAPAPDYTPVAAANEKAAQIAADVSREQLAWAKEQYASDRKVTQQFLDVMMPAMERESIAAAADRERYKTTFQPVEDALVAEARDYASPERQQMESGKAMADVRMANEGQRRGALAQLESYGVDPSMARFGALDRIVRTAEAAQVAGAANAARTQTENIGRALRGEAINIGKGYPGQIATAYQTAQQSGGGAVQANLNTTGSGASTMGTGTQWSGQQQGFLQNWGRNIDGQASAYAADQQASAQASAGIGSMVGSVLGLGANMLMPGSGTGASALGRLMKW